jgi:hypothetical protein
MNTNILLLAFSVGAAFYLAKKQNAQATGPVAPTKFVSANTPLSWVDALMGKKTATTGVEVPNSALPGQPGYGWKYYDNGVSVGPDGAYYIGSSKVWDPTTGAVADVNQPTATESSIDSGLLGG